jgi:hypothetical protein
MRESDGYTHEEIREALAFVERDEWWKGKAMSPVGLRKKNAEGVPKIATILKQARSANRPPNSPPKYVPPPGSFEERIEIESRAAIERIRAKKALEALEEGGHSA